MIDLSPFTKHEVIGPGAEAWLDSLVANKVPTKIGRIALCHALTRRGGIRSEFTITKIAEEHFYVVSAGAAERYDGDYLQKMLPPRRARAGDPVAQHHRPSRGCFVVAGPRSREVLAKLTDTPLDNAAFPWLTGQVAEVGLATDVYLLRVNFVGALGWELHFPIEYAHHLFDAIFAAGAEFGIGMAGMRAMESLRMEKSYRMWGTRPDARLHALRGGSRPLRAHEQGRVHRQARRSRSSSPPACRTASSRFEVHGVTDADPLGNEPLFDSAGRADRPRHLRLLRARPRKSLAIGYVQPEFADGRARSSAIEILGERKRATVLVDSPYDPENKDLRAAAVLIDARHP